MYSLRRNKRIISIIASAVIAMVIIFGSYVLYVKIKYRNTKIIIIEEGLGNQLYEYAFGYILNKKYRMNIMYLNKISKEDKRTWVKYLLDRYNIEVPMYSPNFFEKFVLRRQKDISTYALETQIKMVKEKNVSFLRNRIVDARLIQEYEKDLQEMFLNLAPKYAEELDEKNKAMIKEMQSHKNSVVINIRLGDFLYHPTLNICNFDYYKKAMKVFENMEDVHYYIFSDDIEGARKYFKPNKPHTYVDINPLDKPYLNLILSASGKHNIISNSTFAIWAGILNKNPNKIVVCPSEYLRNDDMDIKKAYSHIYSSKWTIIDTSKDKPIGINEINTKLSNDISNIIVLDNGTYKVVVK